MKRQFLFAACTLFAASALLMTSCQQAEEPIANDPTDQAGPMTRAATLGNFYRVVYVEVNDVNPLNAGEYLLSDGTPFFTHVILFASNIRGDASGNVHNYNNPNNAAILANPAKYIAPLQAKGIKVIMGNLGDHTGAGFANLTAAQIRSRTTQAKNADARGICFFNLPMSPYRLSSFNAAAQAFGETVSHTGKTYSKDYGN